MDLNHLQRMKITSVALLGRWLTVVFSITSPHNSYSVLLVAVRTAAAVANRMSLLPFFHFCPH